MKLELGSVLRYSRPFSASRPTIDRLSNYHHLTQASGRPMAGLERGINPIAAVKTPAGSRRPAVLIRSSPHKAGSVTTPWEDFFDIDNGHIRYYGDNKPGPARTAENAPGNKLLNSLAYQLSAGDVQTRRQAVPLIFFRGVGAEGRAKGNVQFQGFGLIEQVSLTTQWDAKSERYFSNYVYDFFVFSNTHEGERLDWDWINARRDPKVSDRNCLALAPKSWREWVRSGPAALGGVRRSVARNRIVPTSHQLPQKGTKERKYLEAIVAYYAGRQARFEALAEWVIGQVLGSAKTIWRPGWVTKPSGDGGADFVGRLDIGSGLAGTRVVVFGQAKCEALSRATGGNHIARTVARLRRGWIGVYVTTSYFSADVQDEVVADQYPIVLINGKTIADEVAKSLFAQKITLESFLAAIDSRYESRVRFRRPEEILWDDTILEYESMSAEEAAATGEPV